MNKFIIKKLNSYSDSIIHLLLDLKRLNNAYIYYNQYKYTLFYSCTIANSDNQKFTIESYTIDKNIIAKLIRDNTLIRNKNIIKINNLVKLV